VINTQILIVQTAVDLRATRMICWNLVAAKTLPLSVDHRTLIAVRVSSLRIECFM
jgi:hypothetical protein